MRRSLLCPARLVHSAALAGLLLALSACGSSPPVALYRLRADPPAAAASTATVPAPTRWMLASVHLPDYLDRDAILWPSGETGLKALPGQRWAEPLRDAVPRVLRGDLARLRGADRIWAVPMPTGLKADRVLKVEIQTYEVQPDGQTLVLAARWWLTDPEGQAPTQVRLFERREPLAGSSADALVQAHRAALWALAQAIATQGDHP